MRRLSGFPLWMGHVGNARDLRALTDLGIEAVVDLAGNDPPQNFTRDMTVCRFPLIDGGGNPRWLLKVAVDTTAELLRVQVPSLVYCGACMSRTPAVVGAAIAVVRNIDPAKALAQAIAGGPSDVSPALWSDLLGVV